MAIVSTGQFTIIDYNDALTLTGFISANNRTNQSYNPDNASYTPNYASTNLVLTAQLFKAGSSTEILSNVAEAANIISIQWYDDTSATPVALTNNTSYAGVTTRTLTIKTNIMTPSSPGKNISCLIKYKDPTTGLTLDYKTQINLSLVSNGSALAYANVYATNGNVFKNGAVANLPIKAELWRGSVIDTTLVTYKWAIQDPSVSSTSSSGYDATFGIGWKKLSDVTSSVTGTATNTITVYPSLVQNFAVFQVAIKDTDTASPTYNTTFKATCTILDQSDPIALVVTSTGGDVFKNGEGSTVLTAELYQNGAKLNSVTGYTFKWYKYNSSGSLVTGWGGSSVDYKTGQTLSIGSADVDVKATFQCIVEK